MKLIRSSVEIIPQEVGYEGILKRITVRFIIPIGIKCEFIKYRSLFSFSEQLLGCCNYTFSKFGNELTFIEPYWWDSNIDERLEFLQSCETAEKMYLQLIKRGMTPQFAQAVLSLSTKTEIIMTGFVDDWKQFFTKQCSENAHPQVRKLVLDLQELFKINNLL